MSFAANPFTYNRAYNSEELRDLVMHHYTIQLRKLTDIVGWMTFGTFDLQLKIHLPKFKIPRESPNFQELQNWVNNELGIKLLYEPSFSELKELFNRRWRIRFVLLQRREKS